MYILSFVLVLKMEYVESIVCTFNGLVLAMFAVVEPLNENLDNILVSLAPTVITVCLLVSHSDIVNRMMDSASYTKCHLTL